MNPVVLYTMGVIFGLLVAASIGVRVIERGRSRDLGPSELRLRIRTWWIMAAVFTVALMLSRAVSLAFFAFVSFLAFKEYLSLIPTRRADHRVLFWAYLAIPIQYFWIATEWYGLFIIWIPVYMFLFLPMRMILIGETKGYLRAIGTIHWGLMTTVFSLSHIAFLLVLKSDKLPAGGPALVLFLVILTQMNDVAQFIWGKSLGRRKAVPTVSPGKTIEGLIGGVLTTIAGAAIIAPFLTPFSLAESLMAGAIIGLGGFVGDVTISALKRDLAVKDSGTLLPGHGGILDRVDSLTYTAPLFFHFTYYMHF